MESFIHTFNDVNEIVLKQNDMEVPINDIVEGEWKILTINERKKLSGVYFYNPLYISQVYTNNPLKAKGTELEVCINSKEINYNSDSIYSDKLKVFDNGFILEDSEAIYISTILGRLTGFMIILR